MKIYFIKDNSCGDGEIGKHIMLELLKESAALAKEGEAFIFVNEGVNFVVKGEFGELIELLQGAEQRGCSIYVCAHSLKEFVLEEFVRVGKVTSFEHMAKLLYEGETVGV